jgi:hypothetical protein
VDDLTQYGAVTTTRFSVGRSKMNRSRSTVSVGAAALVAALAGAVAVFVAPGAVAGQPLAPTPTYSVNQNGQTIGPWVGGKDGFKPDLVEIVSDNGIHGFARTQDMTWAPATSLEEAARITKSRVNQNGDIVIAVYAADGVTRVGNVTIGHVTLSTGGSEPE